VTLRCYRVASGRRVAPFGDPVREVHVGLFTLGARQEAAVAACGLPLVDVPALSAVTERPALVLLDDVFVTEMALRQFVAHALSAREDLALAVEDGLVARATDPFGEVRREGEDRVYDLALLVDPAPCPDLAALHARTRPWRLPARERTARLALPPSLADDRTPGQREADAPITARIVAPVRHWVQVLRLAQLSIGVELLDALRREPRRMLRLRLMRRRDPWAVSRKLVFVHPTARVHPTADLEACIIGPGAVVEAHAHVHRSVLGAQVRLGDHTAVVGCLLGDRVQVLRASYLALCAAMPGGTLASYKVQMSLFGREVFLTSSAWLIDAKLRGQVQVEHEGRRHAVGPFLGCCLGHRATLGAQVLVQAGRAVPNDAIIVGSPDRFLSRVDDAPAGVVTTIRDGRLVPLE
jgi:hypothetical protein